MLRTDIHALPRVQGRPFVVVYGPQPNSYLTSDVWEWRPDSAGNPGWIFAARPLGVTWVSGDTDLSALQIVGWIDLSETEDGP